MGARPMQRSIQDNIRRASADESSFGKSVDGGTVTVDSDEAGKVTLDFDDHGKPPSAAPDKQELEPGETANCARCGTILWRYSGLTLSNWSALAIAASIIFGVANA
ncbi:hypothetical protein OY671_013089, partial [Metschnikowia pulcherrima]